MPLKPEARAEGMRPGFGSCDAYSLSVRFGLPSSDTAAPTGTTVRDRRYRRQPGFFGGVNLIFFTSSTTVPSGCGMPETAVIALTTLMYFSP